MGSSKDNAAPGDASGGGSLVAFPRARTTKRPSNNLPLELSSFVGREREAAEIKRLLAERRLLTLTGSGGCGKTRLALRVARDLVESFEDGVWLVELAPISDPALMPQAVAQALGVREQPDRPLTDTLVDYLGPRRLLLVLDNCEHLIDACARLAEALLRACPQLRILATSREALGVGGEANWPVPSLSAPEEGRLPEDPARYEAVRLYVERARAMVSDFALTDRNAGAVARVCRRLGGIPLAIELAAARVKVLSVEQIAERLDDSFGLLTTGSRTALPRHRTLRATIDWSHALLGGEEQTLLRRLSVFAGGFTLEAAEAVCAGEGLEGDEVLDVLSLLVEKSLVVREGDGEARYRLLEMVRQYGWGKLEESGEAGAVRRRHAEHYLALAETAEPELLGADQGRWLQRLRTEFGNLRGAFSWSLEPGEEEEERAELRLRLVAALCGFWGREGLEEGKQWLRTALEKDPGGFPAVRAKALSGLGFILLFQQDYGPAIGALEEAIALYKEIGDETGAAFALGNLGYAVLHGDYRERVPAFVQEGEALVKGDLDGHARAYLCIVLGCAAQGEGDLDSAVSRLEEGLALCRELGSLREVGMSLFILGNVEMDRGDLDRGVTLFEEGARTARELGDMLGTAYYVWGTGRVAVLRGNPVRAARLWGAAEGLREQMGMSLSHFDLTASGYEQDLAAVRSTLSEASFNAAWTEGRAMSPEQAIEYALEEAEEPPAAAPPAATAATATPVAPGSPAVGSTEKPAQTLPAQAKAPPPEPLRLFALGASRVERGEHTLAPADFGYAKPRELLFYLLSHPEGRTKEHIGLDLWPEASPSQLRGSLHEALRRLRRALGAPQWIVHHGGGRYAFERSLGYSFDVEAFEANLAAAREPGSKGPAAARRQAISRLEEAVGLYGGEFLEDFLDSEWATERREELRHKHHQALLSLGGLLLEEGRHDRAAEVYRKAISDDEYQEAAHRGLMRCYALMGERGRALAHYRTLVEVLREGLGTGPVPETRALYEGLRRGDEGV